MTENGKLRRTSKIGGAQVLDLNLRERASCRDCSISDPRYSQSVTYETSYLPFIFPPFLDTSESPSSSSEMISKPKGRRAFNKKGQEVSEEVVSRVLSLDSLFDLQLRNDPKWLQCRPTWTLSLPGTRRRAPKPRADLYRYLDRQAIFKGFQISKSRKAPKRPNKLSTTIVALGLIYALRLLCDRLPPQILCRMFFSNHLESTIPQILRAWLRMMRETTRTLSTGPGIK